MARVENKAVTEQADLITARVRNLSKPSNGRFRAECLNAHWFPTLDDARSKLAQINTRSGQRLTVHVAVALSG
jgi:hypothetical protein